MIQQGLRTQVRQKFKIDSWKDPIGVLELNSQTKRHQFLAEVVFTQTQRTGQEV